MRLVNAPCAGLTAARYRHPSNIGAPGFAWRAALSTALKRLEAKVTCNKATQWRDTARLLTDPAEQESIMMNLVFAATAATALLIAPGYSMAKDFSTKSFGAWTGHWSIDESSGGVSCSVGLTWEDDLDGYKNGHINLHIRDDRRNLRGFTFSAGKAIGFDDNTETLVDGNPVLPENRVEAMKTGSVFQYRINGDPGHVGEVSLDGFVAAYEWTRKNCPR